MGSVSDKTRERLVQALALVRAQAPLSKSALMAALGWRESVARYTLQTLRKLRLIVPIPSQGIRVWILGPAIDLSDALAAARAERPPRVRPAPEPHWAEATPDRVFAELAHQGPALISQLARRLNSSESSVLEVLRQLRQQQKADWARGESGWIWWRACAGSLPGDGDDRDDEPAAPLAAREAEYPRGIDRNDLDWMAYWRLSREHRRGLEPPQGVEMHG